MLGYLRVELRQHDDALLRRRLIAHSDKDGRRCRAAVHGHVRHLGGDEQIVARMGYRLMFELIARL